MSSVEGITQFINAIRDLSGVGICYYDLESFFNYNQKGIKNNRGHYCAFCEKVRSLPSGRENCERSDRHEAVALAKQYKTPFFYECHMGMRELVIPLIANGALLGILFVGQCRTDVSRRGEIEENAKRLSKDPNELLSLYDSLPLIPQKDMLNIGKLLSHYFDMKILNSELLSQSSDHGATAQDLAAAIKSFIKSNCGDHSLSPKSIADEFHVNASYASRTFSKKYGTTISEYISFVRTERAKMFLVTTDASVGNIALNVGFEDINYFSRVFKAKVGCAPSQYRKSSHGESK